MDLKQSESQDNQRPAIPEDMMTHIQNLITTTINAAIVDYHNYQAERIEQTLDRLVSEKIEAMRLDPGVSGAGGRKGMKTVAQADAEDGDPRPRAQVTLRCDSSLLDMLKHDAASRGQSLDQMIDLVLRRFYRR